MSRSTFNVQKTYIGNGAVSTYTFDFKCDTAKQLLIVVTDNNKVEQYRLRGDETDPFFTSITVNTETTGGQAVLAAVLDLNWRILFFLAGDEPVQSFQFNDQGSFRLRTFERALDALAGFVQRLGFLAQRSVKLHDADDPTTFDVTLPIGLSEIDQPRVPVAQQGGWKPVAEWTSLVDMQAAVDAAAAAEASANEAELAKNAAEIAAEESADSAILALAAKNAAALSAANAQDFRNQTEVLRDQALASASAAATSEQNAAASALQAEAAEANTQLLKNAAALSASEAADSATAADMSADAALASEEAAEAAVSGVLALGAAGLAPIPDGVDEFTVSFLVPLANPGAPLGTIVNAVDDDPSFLQFIVKSFDADGFTIKLSAPTDSPNYKFDYRVNGDLGNAADLVDIADGSDLVTVIYPVELSSNACPVVSIVNVVDADPIFLSAQIKRFSPGGFTVRLSAPVDSANYQLNYQSGRIPDTAESVYEATVVYPTPLAAPKVPLVSIVNTVDLAPTALTGIIVAFSEVGFTVKLTAPPDSDNYAVSYIVPDNNQFQHDNEAIADTSDTVVVLYGAALPTLKKPMFSIVNTVDADPIQLQGTVVAFDVNGFTVKMNAPADSGNYSLEWRVEDANQNNTFVENLEDIPDATDTVAVVYPLPIAGTNAPVFSIMDIVDTNPISLTGVVTAFSTLGFTVKLSAPTDSINYKLQYHTAEV